MKTSMLFLGVCLTLSAATLGCVDDPIATIRLDVVGTYTLTEVNGSPVGSDETAGVTIWTAPAGCSVDDVQGQTTRVISPGGVFEIHSNGLFLVGLKGWQDCLIDGELTGQLSFRFGLTGSYQMVANELIMVLIDKGAGIHINRGVAEPQPGNQGVAGSIVLFMVETLLNADFEYNLRYVRQ